MEKFSENEQALNDTIVNLRNSMEPPHLSTLKARQLFSSNLLPQREDVISFIASFLNMRVKLYHVVIGFIAIWLCYLYFEQKPATIKQEATGRTAESSLAATANSTLLPSIQTFCQKK